MAIILRWTIGGSIGIGAFDGISGASSAVVFTTPTNFSGTIGTYFTNYVAITNNAEGTGAFFGLTNLSGVSPALYNGDTTTVCMPAGLTFKCYDLNNNVNPPKLIYGALYGTPTTAVTNYRVHLLVGYPGQTPVQTNIYFTMQTASSQPPTIASQPQSLVVTQGNSAAFTITAGGAPAPGYQWQFNTANIAGATQSSYTKVNAQASDAGSYSVLVTNTAGTTSSANAILTVRIPPGISAQPQSLVLTQGNSASFSVTGTGDATLGYQWKLNGGNISGATQSSYTRNNLQSSDAGSYSVTVTNGVGTSNSANAILAVKIPPNISVQPQSLAVTQGNSATFTVTVSGDATLGYQWKLNGGNISGATLSSYTRNNLQSSDAGSYSVTVTNGVGTSNSANAVLTVRTPPGISTQPQSLTVTQGNNATFTVTATGDATLGYQWKFNGTNISGATLTSYTLSNAQLPDTGSYSVTVTNGVGSSNSANALLVVLVPPAISAQPQGVTTRQGASFIFTVTATGTSPLKYQWRFNGGDISGATDSSYLRGFLQSGDAGSFAAVITNVVGAITSADALVTFTTAPPAHIDSITIAADKKIHLQINGGPGNFEIHESPTITNWNPLANFIATNSVFEFVDTDTNRELRYYRIKSLP